MKILIVSDGHGAVEKLDRLEEIAKDCDFVLYGGDFAKFGKPETGKPFLERFAKIHENVFAVSGNCDDPLFREDMDEYDLSIEGTLSFFSGLVLSGSGGGSRFSGTTPNERSDEELAGDLHLVVESVPEESLTDGEGWNNLVIITHNPPANTKLDVAGSGAHVGSPLIRAFIDKYRPLLAVSGHIHESAAVDTVGPTTLVNPGPLLDGRYAIAELTGGGKTPFRIASVELKSF